MDMEKGVAIVPPVSVRYGFKEQTLHHMQGEDTNNILLNQSLLVPLFRLKGSTGNDGTKKIEIIFLLMSCHMHSNIANNCCIMNKQAL